MPKKDRHLRMTDSQPDFIISENILFITCVPNLNDKFGV